MLDGWDWVQILFPVPNRLLQFQRRMLKVQLPLFEMHFQFVFNLVFHHLGLLV